MCKTSLRWWVVWAVWGSLISLVSAFPATLIDRPDLDGGAWWWELRKEASDPDVVPKGTVLTITNSSGLPWTQGDPIIDWTVGDPTGWIYTGNDELLRWEVTADAGGAYFFFWARPYMALSTTGGYTVGTDSGSLREVPVVPEASTVCLLTVGLCAGILLRLRRKKGEKG
jgi:hypothetical protein